ncbi:MAG: PIN domain-containing protein [Dehalococcoidia bacterium]|nr:PIN domain-containing protein [Dehalococcoidia bacterium]
MPVPPGVVLDASVLFPAAMRETLFRAAVLRLYDACLSEEILDELHRSLINTGRSNRQSARRLIDAIHTAFPDSIKTERKYSRLIPQMQNHPKDRHVLALAVATGSKSIVTSNLGHFPESILAPMGITALHPDVFLSNLFEEAPAIMAELVQAQAAALKTPPMTVQDVIAVLHNQGAPRFAVLVKQFLDLQRAQ